MAKKLDQATAAAMRTEARKLAWLLDRLDRERQAS